MQQYLEIRLQAFVPPQKSSLIFFYYSYSEKGSCRAFRNADIKAHLRLAKYSFAIWFQGLQEASPLFSCYTHLLNIESNSDIERQKGCRECLILCHTEFQMRAPIHLNCTQQFRWWGKMFISSMQVRDNVVLSPSLHWLSHSKSICNKLIPRCTTAPWPHTGCTFSICCLSSQVHGMLSASCHSFCNWGLSKSFYNWIQDGFSNPESKDDKYVTFHTLSSWKNGNRLLLQEKLGTKLQRTHMPLKTIALQPV